MLLAFAAALAAAQAPATVPRLGREVTSRGTVYYPNVELRLLHPEGPEPGRYRRVEQASGEHLQNGAYPAPAFAARREAKVGLSLTVDAAGRMTACAIVTPSGAASLDAHACPHLRRAGRFHPALDESGRRVAGTARAELRYFLHRQMYAPAFSPGPASPFPAPPRRLVAPSPALAGIAAGMPQPRDVWSIGGWLGVDASGAVTGCTLTESSWNDALDRQICDRLRRGARYEPARDRDGRAVAGVDRFGFGWPRPAQ